MKTATRNVLVGCLALVLLAAVPYLVAGVFNLVYNDLTLTHGLAEDIEDGSRATHEFRGALDRARLIEGRYLGFSELEGDLRHHVQFDDVLRGDGRVLDVHLARDRFGPTLVAESLEVREGTVPAYLWLQLTCCMDQGAWYELFEIEPGQDKDAADLLRRLFGHELDAGTDELMLVHLDFANVFQFSTSWYHFQRSADGVWSVAGRGSSVAQDYDFELRWVQRDRGAVRTLKLGYAATVPLDVIGWPLHLLALLGLSGVVV